MNDTRRESGLIPVLHALRRRGRTRILGLMSGTSCDGIDAAVVEIERGANREVSSVKVLASETRDFDPDLAEALRRILERGPTATEVAEWDARLGDAFGEVAEKHVARDSEIDVVAVSGHTFAHHPERGATLQVGDPSRVRERVGRPVASAFRTSDVARGGEGAPLVPAGDRLLFSRQDSAVAVLNLGGISNVTWLPNRTDDPVARDCGPANLILDGLWRRDRRDAAESYDSGGATASTGSVDRDLLERWRTHPYFASERRSTGREEFGESWLIETEPDWRRCSFEDRLATASAWIADSIARSVDRFADPADVELLVGGGGAHHARVLDELGSRFACVLPLTKERHGVSADHREAVAFAILADLLLHDEPGSFPTTTGCRSPGRIGAWF